MQVLEQFMWDLGWTEWHLGHVSLCFAFPCMWLRIDTISGVTVIDFYASCFIISEKLTG